MDDTTAEETAAADSKTALELGQVPVGLLLDLRRAAAGTPGPMSLHQVMRTLAWTAGAERGEHLITAGWTAEAARGPDIGADALRLWVDPPLRDLVERLADRTGRTRKAVVLGVLYAWRGDVTAGLAAGAFAASDADGPSRAARLVEHRLRQLEEEEAARRQPPIRDTETG